MNYIQCIVDEKLVNLSLEELIQIGIVGIKTIELSPEIVTQLYKINKMSSKNITCLVPDIRGFFIKYREDKLRWYLIETSKDCNSKILQLN